MILPIAYTELGATSALSACGITPRRRVRADAEGRTFPHACANTEVQVLAVERVDSPPGLQVSDA